MREDEQTLLVRAAVQEAGRIAMRHFRRAHRHWEKGPGQIVTEADIAIDRYLHDALLAIDGEAGWLSEETIDQPSRLDRRRVWIVDPIDGTRSFAEGKPEFTICVALLEAARPALGFVYNPASEELFEAAAGHGAALNGRRLRVSAQAGLEGARVACSRGELRRRDFGALLPMAEVTTIGSLAYKLALVAAGRFDAYLSWRRTQDWDIAAAMLIVEEAGGRITDADGQPIRLNAAVPVHPGILAAAPAVHAALLAATAPARRAHLAAAG
jgi:myo-inositol-1(or 4)-monophosphatase